MLYHQLIRWICCDLCHNEPAASGDNPFWRPHAADIFLALFCDRGFDQVTDQYFLYGVPCAESAVAVVRGSAGGYFGLETVWISGNTDHEGVCARQIRQGSSISIRLILVTVRIAFREKSLRNFEIICHIDSPALHALRLRYVVIVTFIVVNGEIGVKSHKEAN